ncbi:RICIN domain-containing protein [Chitinophaga filiformis]|uniref:Por secretion system C-terminal sorting domain-containing protein n=1 Tax=Chitinophaga filiformis TaxID=104663 RepID=A0A1G7VSF3_CHIFI|nr:RICIN domain-containing protein [Chitinophaga filiformis]SDG61820.1 Por secretion system C-terminal sorting domain-containing protein [Chitinophaga filiformis]
MKKLFFYLLMLCLGTINTYAQTLRTFYIDFGPNDVTNGNITISPDVNGNYWNNVTNTSTTAPSVYLLTSRNASSGAFINITSGFSSNGINNGGLLAPNAALLKDFAINTATQDYFHTDNTAAFIIKGLDVSKGYVFYFFATRNDPEVRKSNYTLTGKTTYTATLQTSGPNLGGTGYNGNNSTIVATGTIAPDAKGQIAITVKRELGSFGYIGALKMEEVRLPVTALKTVYVDFGPNDVTNGNITTSPDINGNYWNNVTNTNTTAAQVNLADKASVPIGAYIKITSGFSSNGIQNGGLLSPDAGLLGDFAIPTATQDYFHTTASSSLSIRGLDKTKGYVFNLFGSRNDPEKRVTTYSLTGATFYNGNLQTSGTDLGGAGYNGNTKTVLTTDIIMPDDNGHINLTVTRAEGSFGYLGLMKMNQVDPVVFEPGCPAKDITRVAIMGSSVPSGTGATNNQGYAQLYAQLLTARANSGVGQPWNVSNISVPGNNTINVINRWDKDLIPLCSKYVIYALSLGNEGITTGGQATFDQFRDNLKLLINKARQQGIEPIITNCYSREDYTATEYNYIKRMNLLIHSWNVASVNLLGALDNGAGRWATGYKSDDLHPNDAGHLEFEYAIVPSLFDALKAGKSQPYMIDGTSLGLSPASGYKLQIKPEEILHSFTLSYNIQTSSTGQVVEMSTVAGQNKLVINASGKMDYSSASSAGIPGLTVLNDNQWHKVTLTHYYAMGKTLLYVDKVLQGSIAEKIVTTSFDLNGSNAPAANYSTLLFHRSGMAAEEINAMVDGNLLKSSLEIYSPLDGANVFSADPIVNLAQSTNKVRKVNLISGTYYLQNRFSNLYMDVDDNQITQDGCNIQQWAFMGTTNQQFTFTHLGNDVYKIICVKSGKSVDVSEVSTADGANVQQWGYVGGANQQFFMVPVDNDYYKIVAKHSGKLVEVSNFSTSNGGNVQQWTDANQISGQWKLVRPGATMLATTDSSMRKDNIKDISVYPNPAVTTLYIGGITHPIGIKIYSSSGQLLVSSFGTSVAVDRLKAGVYFVHLKSKGTDKVLKFIKQ